MRIRPSIILVSSLLIMSGCLGGAGGGSNSPSTSSVADSTKTWTPTPGSPETTTTPATSTQAWKTPSEELLESERTNLITGYDELFQTNSWSQAYPDADFSSWDRNQTLRKLAAFANGGSFTVEKLCIDQSTGQRFLVANATDRVNLDGYRPFNVSARLVVVPGSTESPSTGKIGMVDNHANLTCDRELPPSDNGTFRIVSPTSA
jgi:hypothetical protein